MRSLLVRRQPGLTDKDVLSAMLSALGNLKNETTLALYTYDQPVRRLCFNHQGELTAVKQMEAGEWKTLAKEEEG